MNAQLKQLLIKAIKFIIILVILDLGLGMLVRMVFFTQKSGKFYRMNRSFRTANADVFIFGSSRSNHHYQPEVMKTELGLSNYNVGAQGQQILFQSTVQQIILKRVRPKLLVLDVSPDWMYESTFARDNLSELRPFYFMFPDIIGPVLTLQSKFQHLFLNSRVYQYNSTIVHIIYYRLKPQLDLEGYVPLFHEMNRSDYTGQIISDSLKNQTGKPKKFDTVYENALKSFFKNAAAQNIKVVMVYSPDFWGTTTTENPSADRINAIGRENGIPILDFTNDEYFRSHPELFNDIHHLNDQGAKEFSRLIALRLKGQF